MSSAYLTYRIWYLRCLLSLDAIIDANLSTLRNNGKFRSMDAGDLGEWPVRSRIGLVAETQRLCE